MLAVYQNQAGGGCRARAHILCRTGQAFQKSTTVISGYEAAGGRWRDGNRTGKHQELPRNTRHERAADAYAQNNLLYCWLEKWEVNADTPLNTCKRENMEVSLPSLAYFKSKVMLDLALLKLQAHTLPMKRVLSQQICNSLEFAMENETKSKKKSIEFNIWPIKIQLKLL